jgi:hypothetical protein
MNWCPNPFPPILNLDPGRFIVQEVVLIEVPLMDDRKVFQVLIAMARVHSRSISRRET